MSCCQLLNYDVPRGTGKAARRWIEAGLRCHLGADIFLTVEKVTDYPADIVTHRMRVTGPGIYLQLPVRCVLNFERSAGVRVIPRAIDGDHVYMEFAAAEGAIQ